MKYPLLTLLLFSIAYSRAESDSLQLRYKHQLELIDSLTAFARNELHLYVRDNFYRRWETSTDSMYHYMYTASPDTIATAKWEYLGLGSSREELIKKRKAEGYHTILYKTAGTADAKLNHKLLSYPDEAIAFIFFHELVHNQPFDRAKCVPYIMEEAMCDAIAHYACTNFTRQSGMISMKTVRRQKRIFEKLYWFLNEKRAQLEATPLAQRSAILSECNKRIVQVGSKGNQFIKDRMIYEVNNAYFIRVEPYAINYFRIATVVNSGNFNFYSTEERISKFALDYMEPVIYSGTEKINNPYKPEPIEGEYTTPLNIMHPSVSRMLNLPTVNPAPSPSAVPLQLQRPF